MSFLRTAGLVASFVFGAFTLRAANSAPVADAGGPYTLTVGGSIVLSGDLSHDPDAGDAITSYAWDINGDGIFGDLTGSHPALRWAALSLAPGSHTVSLRVTDGSGATDTSSTVVNVVASPFLVHALFGGQGDDGHGALAGVMQASDGRLYGTTFEGGATNAGMIYRLNPDGTGYETLHSLVRATEGRRPFAGLAQGDDGRLYGTTTEGGANNHGTIFRLRPDGSDFTVLHAFSPSEGGITYARLLAGADGRLYGTTSTGGPDNAGTLFAIGQDGVFVVLHAFMGASEGSDSEGPLVQLADGMLYGMTGQGGAGGDGAIFRIRPDGTGFAVVHSFVAGEAAGAASGLVQASDGKLYGASVFGGHNDNGAIFRLNPDGSGFAVIHSFPASLGATARGGLIQAGDGKLYGLTMQDGPNFNDQDSYRPIGGTVYSITTDGTFALVHALGGPGEGTNPGDGLILGRDGRLYGTTLFGAGNYAGTVFSVTTTGAFTTLHAFGYAESGLLPESGFKAAANGKLYGVTQAGGTSGGGTVFSLTTAGVLTPIYSFNAPADGGRPCSGLAIGSDGKFYGMTNHGGALGGGTLFRINADGSGLSVLRGFSFSNLSFFGSFCAADDGRLYGIVSFGAALFSVGSDGSFATVHAFNQYSPVGAVIQGSDGLLYGVARGSGATSGGMVYRIARDGTGFTVLHALVAATDGGSPTGCLMQANDGKFYGLTNVGGANGNGTIFSITSTGAFAVLHSFSSTTEGANADYLPFDGGSPSNSLIQAADGRLYGACATGGPGGAGTIFSITTSGEFHVVHSLDDAVEGSAPLGALVQAGDGKIYGATSTGGPNGVGAVFAFALSAPVAAFTVSPSPAPVAGPTTFDAGTTGELAGNSIASYAWNFGDGTTTVSVTPITTHAYAASGTYAATLQVTDSLGAVSAVTTVSVTTSVRAQAITFGPLSARTFGDAPFALGATASSGLAPTYGIVSGPATVAGNMLTLTGAGTVVVRTNQAGNATYDAATPVDQSFTVAKADATLMLANLNQAADGAAKTIAVTTVPAGLASTISYDGSSTPPSAAGSYAVVATINDPNYQGSASGTLVLTPMTSAHESIYSGTTSGGGPFALYVRGSGEAVLLVRLPGTGGSFVARFTVAADGSFATSVPVSSTGNVAALGVGSGATLRTVATNLALSGRISGGTLTGAIGSGGETFSGSLQSGSGGTGSVAGYYEAPMLNAGDGVTYFIVGASGSVVAASVAGGTTLVASGAVSGDGHFSVALGAGAVLQGAFNAATDAVSGQVFANGVATGSFGGVSTTVTHTDRLVNISTRGLVGDGDKTMIAGFVIAGSQPKAVLVRASGPTLGSYGVSGTMENPVLRIFQGTGVIASNDDWSTSADATVLDTTAKRVGGFALQAGSKDAALITTLNPGVYSAQVTRAAGSSTGLALVEVYDADTNPGAEAQKVVNISTRGEVRTGDSVMIAGFVITGNAPKKVLIRGVGPTLGAFGVSGVLADPFLKLYQGETLLTTNDDWGAAANATAMVAAASQVGGFALGDGSKDAALLLTLAPGIYSAQVSGAGGATGIALLEVYEVP